MDFILSVLFGVSVFSIIKLLQMIMWRIKANKMLAKLDGPKGHPVLGMLSEVLESGDAMDYVTSKGSQFKSPAKLWFGLFNLVIYVCDPESIKKILNSEETLDKADFYRITRLEKTIFAEPKDVWKVHRKVLNTLRNRKRVLSYSTLIFGLVEKLVKTLEGKVNQDEFDIFCYVGAYTLDFIFKVAFEIDLNALDDPERNKILEYIEKSNEIYAERGKKLFYIFEPIYRLSKLYKKEQKYNLNSFYDNLIEEKMDDWKKREACNKDDLDLIVQLFLKPETKMSYEEMRDSMRGLVFAAFETTALALSSALLMLAMHPEIQKKLHDEISSIPTADLDYNLIKSLSYLDLVVKETQRLFPPGAVIGRYASENLSLNEDVTIPAGSNIFIDYFRLQREPKYWGDDAHLFVPERFETHRMQNVHPYAYIPFSAGPRNCIAQTYGVFLLKTALIGILRKFRISTSLKFEEIKVEALIALKVVQGYNVRIEKR